MDVATKTESFRSLLTFILTFFPFCKITFSFQKSSQLGSTRSYNWPLCVYVCVCSFLSNLVLLRNIASVLSLTWSASVFIRPFSEKLISYIAVLFVLLLLPFNKNVRSEDISLFPVLMEDQWNSTIRRKTSAFRSSAFGKLYARNTNMYGVFSFLAFKWLLLWRIVEAFGCTHIY